jgi:hypothetical protein
MAVGRMLLRLLIAAALGLAVLGIGGAAFSAANTVPESSAGDGSETISGYTITAITYNVNGANPQNIDSVTFTATADNGSAAGALTTIRGRFVAGGGWYTCTRSGGVAPAHNISCDTTAPQLTVLAADEFTAVIIE